MRPNAQNRGGFGVQRSPRPVRILATLVVSLLLSPAAHAWWNDSWDARSRLTFNNSGQPQDLDDFPVLVVLDPGNIDYGKTETNGEDLRFIDADDATPLKHEIERWTPGGTSYVWVRVPRIDASSPNDFIYLYYDSTGASSVEDPPGVWNAGFLAVWHLDDDPTGGNPVRDSTTNAKHGTGSASMSATNVVPGKIGESTDFDGSADYVRVPSGAGDVLEINGDNITLEAWVRRNGDTAGSVWMALFGRQFGTTSADSYTQVLHRLDPSQALVSTTGGNAASATGAVLDLTWTYLAATQDASFIRQYVGGGQVDQNPPGSAITSDPNDVTLGAMENDGTANPTEWYVGRLDEVRISGVTRTTEWIRAQNLSMTDNFVTFTEDGEISGTVFEDVNYGGGAGRDRATAAADAPTFTVVRGGVTVELYDAAGNHVGAVSPQTTDASGAYSFTGLASGNYTVRVVNSTVTSSRPGSDGMELAVQTYRIDGAAEAAGDGAKKVGGELPSNEDAAANSGAQTLASLQGTDLDTDGITERTQSIVTVTVSGDHVAGVDFGFNFDTIVNTNDKDQGSLRQFILNSNLLN